MTHSFPRPIVLIGNSPGCIGGFPRFVLRGSVTDRKLLLVLEQDAFVRKMFERSIKAMGYEFKVLEGTSAHDGFELLKTEQVDAIIVDAHLPFPHEVRGGYRFLKEIKQISLSRKLHPPCGILVLDQKEEIPEHLFDLKCIDRTIAKPVDPLRLEFQLVSGLQLAPSVRLSREMQMARDLSDH